AMSAACEQGGTGAMCDHAKVQQGLIGNLCRCTGYLPIIAAEMAAIKEKSANMAQVYDSHEMISELERASRESVLVEAAELKYFKPTAIEEAVKLKADNPQVMVIAGGTDLGVRINKGVIEPTVVMSLSGVSGIDSVEEVDGVMRVGAA